MSGGQGFRFGGAKARQMKERIRQIRTAKDLGYGQRCVALIKTNPYHPGLPEHAAYEEGWRIADRDLAGCER